MTPIDLAISIIKAIYEKSYLETSEIKLGNTTGNIFTTWMVENQIFKRTEKRQRASHLSLDMFLTAGEYGSILIFLLHISNDWSFRGTLYFHLKMYCTSRAMSKASKANNLPTL